jgi:hypothetical protein
MRDTMHPQFGLVRGRIASRPARESALLDHSTAFAVGGFFSTAARPCAPIGQAARLSDGRERRVQAWRPAGIEPEVRYASLNPRAAAGPAEDGELNASP